jgi:hypothetical protein
MANYIRKSAIVLEPVYDLEAGYCREDSKVIIGQPSVR